MVSVGRMKTGGGASAPLPFFSLRPYVVGVPKTGHKIWRRSGHLWLSQVNKRWRGRLPPSVRRYAVAACAPADAPPRPRNWILRRPRRQRRGAPARRLAGVGGLRLAPAAVIWWGGGAAGARYVVGDAPLSCGCGGACRVWGRGLLSWRRRGLNRSAPLHSKPPAPPRPQSPPPCACGRGVKDAPPAGGGRARSHLPAVFHINVVMTFDDNRRYTAYAVDFLRTITRILRASVSYHKKLVTFASYG